MAPHAAPFPDRMNSIVEFRLELNEIIEVPNKKVCLCSEEKDRFFYADRDIQKIRMRGMVCRDLLRMYEEMVAAEERGPRVLERASRRMEDGDARSSCVSSYGGLPTAHLSARIRPFAR